MDRAHILATPGLDAHGGYVALSRHRLRLDLHYGHDDFANQDRLAGALSRDRAKDMASDYEQADPAQDYAERRGITFRARVAKIVRKIAPEKVRGMFDGLRLPADGGQRPERESAGMEAGRAAAAPARQAAEDRGGSAAQGPHEGAHPTCVGGGRDSRHRGCGRQGQSRADARAGRRPENLRGGAPHGWGDAEAAYVEESRACP